MRISKIVMLALSLAIVACSDMTAPSDPTSNIELPPFSTQALEATLGYTYAMDLVFYSPIGVDPVIDVRRTTSAVRIIETPRTAEADLTCASSSCNRTRWRQTIVFTAEELGESFITVELRFNTQKYSGFRVKVVAPTNE